MIDKLFTLLSHNPLISTIGLIVLTGFLAWLFRDEIKSFIKKRFDLYDRAEVHQAVVKTQEINSNMAFEAETETMAIQVVDNLEHKAKS